VIDHGEGTEVPMLDGKDYVAKVRLYGADQQTVVAEVGGRCDKIDARSLGWLIGQGLIKFEERKKPVQVEKDRRVPPVSTVKKED
jgi:hypothetical protein